MDWLKSLRQWFYRITSPRYTVENGIEIYYSREGNDPFDLKSLQPEGYPSGIHIREYYGVANIDGKWFTICIVTESSDFKDGLNYLDHYCGVTTYCERYWRASDKSSAMSRAIEYNNNQQTGI